MNELKTYYRAMLQYSESGAYVDMTKWSVVYETKCYVYCVPEYVNFSEGSFYDSQRKGLETNYQLAKRMNIRLHKIHKESSRFAFDTEEKAFQRLKFIKHYHLRHLRHQLQLVESFLETASNGTYKEFQSKTSITIEGLL
jgi:hypothetical protein